MKEILISLATRGRPAKAAGFVDQWRKTTSGRSEIVFAMELDDPLYGQYAIPLDAKLSAGMFGSQGTAINAVLEDFPDYPYYAFLSDDHRLNTHGWEDMVIDAVKNGGVAYGDDGYQGKNLATASFWHGDTLRAVGYVAPPGMRHMYIDNVWGDLGRSIGKLFYLPKVSVEHLHPMAGKATWDEHYQRVNAPESYAYDLSIYEDWRENELPKATERMKKVLGL